MKEKVKCKTCGKVGFLSDKKGLMRHLRLIHNTCVSKKDDINDYFESANSDSIIEIKSVTPKAFRKERNRKWNKRERGASGSKLNEREFVRIIYTPMING